MHLAWRMLASALLGVFFQGFEILTLKLDPKPSNQSVKNPVDGRRSRRRPGMATPRCGTATAG